MGKRAFLIAGAVAVVTLAVMSGALGADFVMWDDDVSIYQNPGLGGFSWARLLWVFSDVDSMMRYCPLTLLGWVATCHFFGLDPFWFHLGNWLLHAASAALLFVVVREVLRISRGGGTTPQLEFSAAAAALLWALHPLRVEPVAWATDRTYCQAMAFLLLSVLFYIRAHDPAHTTEKKKRWPAVASFAAYTVSLFSHPVAATFTAVLLILDMAVLGRIGGEVGWRSERARRALQEKALFAAPAAALIATTVAIRAASAGVWEPPVPLSEFGLLPRVMQALYIAAYYLWRPFWPFDLSPVYTTLVEFDPLSQPFMLSAGAMAALGTAAFLLRRRLPAFGGLLAAHLILLVPVMGFWEHPHYHSDRYSLLPGIVLSLAVALSLAGIRRRDWSIAAILALLVVNLGLGWLSVRQVRIWRDSETLFRHMIITLGNDPYRQDIHWRLGHYLARQGRRGAAIAEFERTIAIEPLHAVARGWLVNLELERGNLRRAAGHLQVLVRADPGNRQLRAKLDGLLEYLGSLPAAGDEDRRDCHR